jgi:hypothetical protein
MRRLSTVRIRRPTRVDPEPFPGVEDLLQQRPAVVEVPVEAALADPEGPRRLCGRSTVDINYAALGGAVAASIGVLAHGVAGQMWLTAQLRAAAGERGPTELSARLFGPADVSAQVLGVAWHAMTGGAVLSWGASNSV